MPSSPGETRSRSGAISPAWGLEGHWNAPTCVPVTVVFITTDPPGAALAGSVNMVSRTAFERSKPFFKGSVSLLARGNALDFDKTDGPCD